MNPKFVQMELGLILEPTDNPVQLTYVRPSSFPHVITLSFCDILEMQYHDRVQPDGAVDIKLFNGTTTTFQCTLEDADRLKDAFLAFKHRTTTRDNAIVPNNMFCFNDRPLRSLNHVQFKDIIDMHYDKFCKGAVITLRSGAQLRFPCTEEELEATFRAYEIWIKHQSQDTVKVVDEYGNGDAQPKNEDTTTKNVGTKRPRTGNDEK